jgi:hypothetical protein
MKWIKRTAYAVFVLLAVYFGAIELAKRQFEPETFRRMLADYVQKEFDSKLEIYSVRTTPFPHFGLTASAVKMEGGGLLFSVERATVMISPLSLLLGNVVVTDLNLEKPMALLRRYKKGSWNFQKLFSAGGKKDRPLAVRLKKASISGGNVTVIDDLAPGDSAVYRFTVVDVEFRAYSLYTTSHMMLSANLQGKERPSKLKLKFYSRAAPPYGNWRESQLDGKIAIQSVKPDEFRHYIGSYFPKEFIKKTLNFNVEFSGVPSKSMDFKSELLFRPGGLDAGPLLSAGGYKGYSKIEADGTVSPDDLTMERISIVLPEIALKGTMEIKNYLAPDPDVRFRFKTSFINISRLTQLVPPAYRSEPMINFMDKNIVSGQFRLSEVAFNGPYSRFINLDNPDNLGMLSGKMEVKDFTLNLKNFDHPVDRVNGVILLKPDAVSFSGISAVYGKNRLKNITGSIENIHKFPLLRAVIDADLDLKEFHEELLKNISSPELAAVFKPIGNFKGNMEFNFNIAVDLRRQMVNEFDGKITLADIGFDHDYFRLPITNLAGSVRVNLANIFVQNITWNTGSITCKATGRIKDYSSSDYRINFTFDTEGELSEFAKSKYYNIPFLEDIKGPVNVSLDLEGDFFQINFSHRADLTKAEYSLHGLKKPRGVAFRHKINGRLFEGKKMLIEHGKLTLGNMVFLLSGKVEDITLFDNYDLDLKLERYALKNIRQIIPSFSEGDAEGYLSGRVAISGSHGITGYRYRFEAEIGKLNLEPLGPVSPLLTRINPKGYLSGWIEAAGEKGKWPSGKGEIIAEGIGFKTKLYKPFSGLTGKGTLKGDRFEFANVTAMVGDSRGTVSGTIEMNRVPVFDLVVDAEELNLDDFVKIKKKDEKEPEEVKKKNYEEFFGIHPRFYLKIRSKKGRLHKLDYRDIGVSFDYYHHNYAIPKFSFLSHKGMWEGNGTISTEGGARTFEGNLQITDMDIRSFSPVLWEKPGKLTGRLDLHGWLSGEGFAWKKLRRTLDAELEFTARDGMLEKYPGMAAIFTIINVVPIFEGRTKEQKGVGVPYKTIKGTMKIERGVGYTADTRLEGSVVRMSAVGKVKFNEGTVDLMLGIKPFTTVDRIISKIPIAGKILTGEEKALIIHYYEVTGKYENLDAKSVPSKSIGRTIFGIFKRVLELPAKALSIKPKKKGTAEPGQEDESDE